MTDGNVAIYRMSTATKRKKRFPSDHANRKEDPHLCHDRLAILSRTTQSSCRHFRSLAHTGVSDLSDAWPFRWLAGALTL